MFGIGIDVGGCLEFQTTFVVVWNCRWWLFGIDVGDNLELSLMVVWKPPTCLETTLVVVWNNRWWLFGQRRSKQPPTWLQLELSLVVVWNGRWWLVGMDVDNSNCQPPTTIGNNHGGQFGTNVGGCLELSLVVAKNHHCPLLVMNGR